VPASERPSRRELLTGRLAASESSEAHVSSLVVHVRPEKAPAVRAEMARMPGVEVHAEEAGKIIITLETDTEADIVARLNDISLLDGVMSATLVFHHFEAIAGANPAVRKG
jgi:periplasmic nitrate reductase NapD